MNKRSHPQFLFDRSWAFSQGTGAKLIETAALCQRVNYTFPIIGIIWRYYDGSAHFPKR